MTSKIMEFLRRDLAQLYDATAICKVKMRKADAICLPSVWGYAVVDITHLHKKLKFSQPVFVLHLHTTTSTVYKWKQNDTHQAYPALKLLNIIANKGLQAIFWRPVLMTVTHG